MGQPHDSAARVARIVQGWTLATGAPPAGLICRTDGTITILAPGATGGLPLADTGAGANTCDAIARRLTGSG